MLDCTGITSVACITPSHHGAIPKQGGEGLFGRLDLLNALQLMLNFTAVTTEIRATPRNYRAIDQDSSKSFVSCLKGTRHLHKNHAVRFSSDHHPKRNPAQIAA